VAGGVSDVQNQPSVTPWSQTTVQGYQRLTLRAHSLLRDVPVHGCLARCPSGRRAISHHERRSLRFRTRQAVSASESPGPDAVRAAMVTGTSLAMGSSCRGTRSMVYPISYAGAIPARLVPLGGRGAASSVRRGRHRTWEDSRDYRGAGDGCSSGGARRGDATVRLAVSALTAGLGHQILIQGLNFLDAKCIRLT
jgi:hypothetical protein